MTAENRDRRAADSPGRRDFLPGAAGPAAGSRLGCSSDSPARRDARPLDSASLAESMILP